MASAEDGGSDLPGPAGVLIGRDSELAFIGSFVERAATEGGVLLLSGEAGVGKTLLLEVAAARAAAASPAASTCTTSGTGPTAAGPTWAT